MTAPLNFIVPGQPVAKARARTVVNRGKVHSFTPDKTARYENLVRMAFVEKYPGHVPIEGPVSLSITAYFQVPKGLLKKWGGSISCEGLMQAKRPDADNLAKSCADALNGIAWRDDAQVTDLGVFKRYSMIPRVEISISAINPSGLK